MLKWRHHVASQRIQDFLEVLYTFFQYKMRYLVVSKKKNPLFMWEWDRKFCPSRSPFVITRQASWCQWMILGTDFSILPSHSWWILIFPNQSFAAAPFLRLEIDFDKTWYLGVVWMSLHYIAKSVKPLVAYWFYCMVLNHSQIRSHVIKRLSPTMAPGWGICVTLTHF